MKRAVEFDGSGNPVGVALYMNEEDAVGFVLNDEDPRTDQELLETLWLKDGQVYERPARPSEYHEWQESTGVWELNLVQAREAYRQAVTALAEATAAKGSLRQSMHQEKLEEALAGGGPTLAEEAILRNMSQEALSVLVQEKAEEEAAQRRRTEMARVQANLRIDQATRLQEMEQAVAGLREAITPPKEVE